MMSGHWRTLLATTAIAFATLAGTAEPTQAGVSTTGGGDVCAPAAGLSLAINAPPQPGSVDADGDLILYCRTPATNSRDGVFTQGTNTEYTPPILGAACSVDIQGEGAQVLSEPGYQSGWEGGPETVEVFPIAFWTGTEGAMFAVQSPHFLWGGVSDTTQTALGANWSAVSPYGPEPPSGQPGSGLSTSAMITSGLENSTVDAWITTVTPGGWGHGANGDWVCRGPTLSVSLQQEQDTSTPPSQTSVVVPSWAPPTEQEALDSLAVAAGQVQTSAPDNYVVFAPTCFWVSPQPVGPPFGVKVENILGPPDANGESIVYSYYLDVAPSATVHWSFGDGTGEDVPASSSGPGSCVTHYYKQVSGEGSVPEAGATVSASQDVMVTAFVGWVDQEGSAHYHCVTPEGGLGGADQGTEATAAVACSTTYAGALMDTPLPPKPVYQVRAIPVA